MASKIHLLCRDRLGIECADKKAAIYTSAAWLLSKSQADDLLGGTVHFHQAKSQPSYFGGVIQSLYPTESLPEDELPPERLRYVITLQATAEAKGAKWDRRGLAHGMAWSSGVIDDDA